MPLLHLTAIRHIESVFTEVEPDDIAGEPFTPAFIPQELVLEDTLSEPDEGSEKATLNEGQLGEFEPLAGTERSVTLVAVDAGVVGLGECRTGFALAFKAAVLARDTDGTHRLIKVGPRVKFITPGNQTDVLRYLGRELVDEELFVEKDAQGNVTSRQGSTDPSHFKDQIRNIIERLLQADLTNQLENGILLIDRPLTLRTQNTPPLFLAFLAQTAARRNTDIVGVSKRSNIRVGGVHISSLLDGDPHVAGFRRIDTAGPGAAGTAAHNLGVPFAVRFGPVGRAFRVDVARRSDLAGPEATLHTLWENSEFSLGYPKLLQLAHVHAAFTKSEIIGLQVQACHDYGLSMMTPETVM